MGQYLIANYRRAIVCLKIGFTLRRIELPRCIWQGGRASLNFDRVIGRGFILPRVVVSRRHSGLWRKRAPTMTNFASLPYFTSGPIVKGFGRGSQALGIPTANFPEDVVSGLPDDFDTGIYYGWAEIDGDIYKMVMSIGWNPFFKNEKKSMETHILHKFPGSLHGKELRIIITGYIRPEKDFSSIEALIEAINNDISIADRSLDEPAMLQYKEHAFFKQRKSE